MVELNVQGMTCGHCVKAVTNAIQALDPGARVTVDLAAGLVRAETGLAPAEVARAIQGEGYKVTT